MSLNPYESPSAAGFDEIKQARMVLDVSQQPVVERFIILNRIVALSILGTGAFMTLLMIALGFGNADKSIVALGIPAIVLGAFQLRRNIVAISLTGATAVAIFALVAFSILVAILRGRVRVAIPAVDAWIAFGFAALVLGSLIYVPAWVAIRAWAWRIQGIDLTKLENVQYGQPGGYLTVP